MPVNVALSPDGSTVPWILMPLVFWAGTGRPLTGSRRYRLKTVPAVIGLTSGSTSVKPGAGSGKLGSGLSCMLVKKEAGFTEKPAGVGTASGLLRTSIATVVELLTAPAGKVSEPREPKTVSFTVPPKELTVPSGVRLGW